jgi:hypothetical protein
VSTDFAAAATAVARAAAGPEHGIVQRADGVYADPGASGASLAAALDAIFKGGGYLTGVDYPALMKVLYEPAGAFTPTPDGVRIADGIQPFDAQRRSLYRAVKIAGGSVAYVFEPVWLPDPADPEGAGLPARLDLDEFIADMWGKGIRYGIDVGAVRAIILSGRTEHVTVARRLDAVPGQDARIVEVSDHLHRNDAPRQLANGHVDMNQFQNRFPQIQPGVRLLQKIPATAGSPGFEMSGAKIEPTAGKDVDLNDYAGEGTAVEKNQDGEFLVSKVAGFLQVDSKTSRISVGPKIVSRDGVSVKTTGNLQLTGDYEEFGDVQEKREVEGESITVHGDVFGRVASRGGLVLLNANLMGGSAFNKLGDIRVRGVASGAVIQATQGAVVLERAENCIVTGTRIRVAHAVNCEIIGDEVTVGMAEGSAIAGRRVTIEACTPRKQGEMLVYVMRPEGAQIGEIIAMVGERIAQFNALAARHREEMRELTARSDVRSYLMLSAKVRKNEVNLTPEQARQFQKMAQDVGPALKAIGDVSAKLKAAEAELQKGQDMLANLEEQKRDASCVQAVSVRSVQGDTQVRVLGFNPAAGSPYDLPPREIRTRLRGPQHGELLFSGASGTVDWNSEQADAAPAESWVE